MITPMEIIRMIRSGQNPQQLTLRILEEQMGSTPFGANLLNLAKNNKTAEIEQIVRNLMQQQGVDFDKEFAFFKEQIGL